LEGSLGGTDGDGLRVVESAESSTANTGCEESSKGLAGLEGISGLEILSGL